MCCQHGSLTVVRLYQHQSMCVTPKVATVQTSFMKHGRDVWLCQTPHRRNDDTTLEGIRGRFVTGDWGADDAARQLAADAALDTDPNADAVFGDFEDLETGEK